MHTPPRQSRTRRLSPICNPHLLAVPPCSTTLIGVESVLNAPTAWLRTWADDISTSTRQLASAQRCSAAQATHTGGEHRMSNPSRRAGGVWDIPESGFAEATTTEEKLRFLLRYAVLAPSER